MSGHVIRCRAKIAGACFDGKPSRMQFGEDLPLTEDGTFLPDEQGGSLVCDACYMKLGGPTNGPELENAIARYHEHGVRMVECPAEGCTVRLEEADSFGQKEHLETVHPELIEKRLREAGLL